MMAYINQEAWDRSLKTGEAHYWSRSRRELWHKGGTSGHVQKIKGVATTTPCSSRWSNWAMQPATRA
ncbi:Phosphoribosyl-AMP cyclohydrolase (modular protein) [Desulfarculales bacterium]